MGLVTFIIILIVSIFFSLHNDLYWIIYDYRPILWIAFAFSIYITVKKHEIKGVIILFIFSLSIFMILSHLVNSNLIFPDIMIVIKNVFWGSVIAFVFNIGDVVYYVCSNLGYTGANIHVREKNDTKIRIINEENNDVEIDRWRIYEIQELEQECQEIDDKIQELYQKRSEIRTGGWLDNIGYDEPMSREEENRNRRLYDEISAEIRDLEFQKSEKELHIRSLRK